MDKLKHEEGDNLCLVTYQIGNSLSTMEHRARTREYYADSRKPRFYIDGKKSSTNYPSYDQHRSTYESRRAVASPATIVMESSCPQNQGAVKITITNTSNSEISAMLHAGLTEYLIVNDLSGKPRKTWTVRDMLPDAKGEHITLAVGESVTKNRSFAVKSGWKKEGCKLIAFIQTDDKEILQGCTVGLNQGVPICTNNQKIIQKVSFGFRNGSFMIHVPFARDYTLLIVDIRGKILEKSRINNCNTWHSLENSVPTGIHLVRVTTADRTIVRKVKFIK